MVSFWVPNSVRVIITGSRLAGMYIMQAAMRKAQVSFRLCGLRVCRCVPQRPQGSPSCASFQTAPQWRQAM